MKIVRSFYVKTKNLCKEGLKNCRHFGKFTVRVLFQLWQMRADENNKSKSTLRKVGFLLLSFPNVSGSQITFFVL